MHQRQSAGRDPGFVRRAFKKRTGRGARGGQLILFKRLQPFEFVLVKNDDQPKPDQRPGITNNDASTLGVSPAMLPNSSNNTATATCIIRPKPATRVAR